MKTIIRSTVILSLLVGLNSCSKFLEINPSTQVSEQEFYKNEQEVMMGLHAVMDDAQNGLMEVFSYASLLSDESESGGGIGEGVYKEKYDRFTFDPTTSPAWWNEWDYGLYNGVTSCNILISKLNQSSLPATFTNAISAEAKFYRALFYYHLFMGYEQFPLIGDRLSPSQIYSVKKGTREEIYQFMMNDLSNDIIQYLPEKGSTQKGRVSKDAARVLRAKIVLFQRDEKAYPTALADLKEIIASKRYALLPDYTKIWLKEGEFSSENIYDIAYAGNNSGEGNGLGRALSGRGVIDPRSAAQGGLREGYGQNTMPSTIYRMFKTGDTRREGTVIDYKKEIDKVNALVASGQLESSAAFRIQTNQEKFEWLGHYKYHARKENATDVNPLNNYSMPFRFFRYADVLLLATELQVRSLGQVDAEGQVWFDQIRDRAFQNASNRISLQGLSKTDALNRLFEERGYEFIDEMQRWFDIMRFDKGTEILAAKGWTEKFRYFPIAQKEIDASKGALDQNPGWK
ncbi:RagB/SusD family nutrient uptake outer membrane protein [Sphingobacterium sp. MYb382]|uniref:RagB/SusD family nutrient uptake outer membrane protein n=1 Tax=Sphingobacterium sp. MYb382 TaxID=2745278 RepID=UPI0030A22F87